METVSSDYEIKCWGNSNLEAIDNSFLKNAIVDKRWAFVADYVRLIALYNEGGIYFDTDVRLYKNISHILDCNVMIPTQKSVTTGYNLMSAVIAAVSRHPYIKACIDYYSKLNYDPQNYLKIVINPIMSSILHDKWGYKYEDKYQELSDDIHILDRSFFGSDFDMGEKKPVEFYGVHFCNQSWIPSNRGRLYRFCKSNDLMSVYKSISSLVQIFKS